MIEKFGVGKGQERPDSKAWEELDGDVVIGESGTSDEVRAVLESRLTRERKSFDGRHSDEPHEEFPEEELSSLYAAATKLADTVKVRCELRKPNLESHTSSSRLIDIKGRYIVDDNGIRSIHEFTLVAHINDKERQDVVFGHDSPPDPFLNNQNDATTDDTLIEAKNLLAEIAWAKVRDPLMKAWGAEIWYE